MKLAISLFFFFANFSLLANPNVLFIAIDDLNDWVGCLDTHPDTHTPHIDALAARGTLFTNAHCQAPICGPSRASLLSGRFPHTTGVYAQPDKNRLVEDPTFFDGKLLPQYFAKHGYKTMAAGKITHGYPLERAFQEAGPGGSSGPKPPDGKRFNYSLPDVPWSGTQTDWGPYPEQIEEMPDHQTADWIIEQLTRKHDKPFFLAAGIHRPHVPFYVPQDWLDRYDPASVRLPEIKPNDLDDVPEISRALHAMPKYPDLPFLQRNESEQFRKCVAAYLACIEFADHQVGRILHALNSSAHAKNTIIVLFSDHGYHLGEKNRVSKHSLWEESTRVPLIIARPGDQATRNARPVGLIDLYPTLLSLCKLPINSTNEGMDLSPLLTDPKAKGRFAISTDYARENHTLRSQTHRYIRYEDGSEELYDHRRDPHEWVNLAGNSEHEDVLKQFRRALPDTFAPYHPSSRDTPVNPWFKEHFERHGLSR